MIPVRHSSDIHTSRNIHGFRSIRHSTRSQRLFGADPEVELRPWRGDLGELDLFGNLSLGNGRLELRLINEQLDTAVIKALTSLEAGSVGGHLLGGFLRSLYLRLRGDLAQLLLETLYRVLVAALQGLYRFVMRVLLAPLTIITVLMVIVLGVALL